LSINKAVTIFLVLIVVAVCIIGLNKKYRVGDFKTSPRFLYDKTLMEWVRHNTSDDAVFLVPTYFHAWMESHRPAFYDPNIINAASYNKVYMMDAIDRFQTLMEVDIKSMKIDEPTRQEVQRDWSAGHYQKEKYDSLDERKVLEIKKKYGISYFVTSSPRKYSFPLVYKNELYAVYKPNS
jgi:activator of 2-hydroxyglutaryl-CoA dehydratase